MSLKSQQTGRWAIEDSFPIVEINRLAVPERNSFKPIYQMHKWFARRASCVFRAILLGCLKPLPVDENGNPTGGSVRGTGLAVDWQNGPLGRGEDRKEPNGAFVETVIDAARQRIEFYQASQFKCRENAIAITKLEEALLWLNKRTADREKRNVEGEHKI